MPEPTCNNRLYTPAPTLIRWAFAAMLTCALPSAALAAFVDVVVVGTWENTNVPPVNVLGLVNGDKFVMKGTYDDTTLFNGPEGVTATIDPTVNAGTSFDLIIPHSAGAPNPLVFDHSDHRNIGFAPFAEIEFNGSDATVDPGFFRNFEIHIDFNFGPNAYDFDTFMGAIQEETALFNETQGFNLAAVGTGADHLQVVVNDIIANSNGPYVFNAANLSLNLAGNFTGGSGFGATFDWAGSGGALANSPGANISFGLAESGLTTTTGTTTIDLVVTEDFTDFASAPDVANVSYSNSPPNVLSASGTAEVDDSITFSATANDDDLAANALVPGFETLTVEFLFAGSVFLTGNGNIDLASLISIFGGPGMYNVDARATDAAGATSTLTFPIGVNTPSAPMPIVSDDFDTIDGGGIGWAVASTWGGALNYVSTNPIDPDDLQHVHTTDGVAAFRDIDPAATALLHVSDDVWIAFEARLDFLKTTSQFAGISLFADAAERYFAGGLFVTQPWGGVVLGSANIPGTTPAGAEWASILVHFDYDVGQVDIYVNRELQASDTTLPPQDWNRIRITSGSAPANRLFADRLRIGTTRYDVEAPLRPSFAAAQWSDASVRLLDRTRADIGGFAAGAPNPNGIATDGLRIFTGHFSTQEVVIHDLAGAEQARWFAPELSTIMGLEYVDGELAVRNTSTISFFTPESGDFIRSITPTCSDGSPEGLAYDGAALWVSCGATLEAIDPIAGTFLASIPNASSGCQYGGTGITASGPGELSLACTDGSWFRVSAADGSTIDSGNNGADMYGIKYLPEPTTALMLAAGVGLIAALRRQRGVAY
jgi:hypothetical protein